MKKITKTLKHVLSTVYCRPIYMMLAILVLCSHDLYLKMETYFLQPNQEATLNLYNGTFEKSENIITRDRMLDASVVAHGERTKISDEQWTDQDSIISQFNFTTGKAGTYLAGVSTKARNIKLSAKDFNDYLKHDGILDILAQREKDSTLDQDAIESYQKHVKAIYQVGDVKTDDWKTVLGYPIELVPQANPYEKYSGNTLQVQLLLDGRPLPNQLVYADHISKKHSHDSNHTHGHEHDKNEHSHGEKSHSHDTNTTDEHTHTNGQKLRTDAAGMVMVNLPEDGIYYLRTIHMVTTPNNEELTHESKWATLTFEVTHEHGSNTHTHDQEEGLPIWFFILGSALFIAILFFAFRKKN